VTSTPAPASSDHPVVPKGTATVALKNRNTSILFNQPYTELDAIVVGYFAPLVVGTGKSGTNTQWRSFIALFLSHTIRALFSSGTS